MRALGVCPTEKETMGPWAGPIGFLAFFALRDRPAAKRLGSASAWVLTVASGALWQRSHPRHAPQVERRRY